MRLFCETVLLSPFIAPDGRASRSPTDRPFLNSFTFARHPRGMNQQAEFYQGQAQAAMKMAAATTEFERLQWVRMAQAWHDLATVRTRLTVAKDGTS